MGNFSFGHRLGLTALIVVTCSASCGSQQSSPPPRPPAEAGDAAPTTLRIEDIPECVDYLDRMERCAQALDEDQRAHWRAGTARGKQEWQRRLAKGGSERDFVRNACAYATRSMKDSARYVRICDGVWDDPPAALPPPNPKAPVYSVPACADYISKMETCLATKDMRSEVREIFQRQFDEKRSMFEGVPEGSTAFQELPSVCASLTKTNQSAMAAICPGVW